MGVNVHTDQDRDGLAEFVAARGPALLRLAWLLTADGDAAEDLVQDALVRAMPKWNSIQPAAREAYLRRTIRSSWIDGWRRRGRGRFGEITGPAAQELVDQAIDDVDVEGFADRVALAQALAQLAPGQRAVLVLRFYEDQTEVQTAKALGCAVSTVKTQTRAALQRLRELVPANEVTR